MMKLAWLGAGIAAVAYATATCATPLTTGSLTTYGTPGLIEMPTAESLPDGEFVSVVASTGPDLRTTVTFQFHPRLTGSFRYAFIPEFNQNTRTDRFDRSFDIRYRFADETRWRPALAVGLQDFVGTGVYSGEYVVATKTINPRLRVTAGLGWGRLGSYGALATIGKRPPNIVPTGGQANTAQWFRGDIAPFFGVSYQASNRLTLKAEYSSDGYDYEVQQGLIDRRTPLNLGLQYELFEGAQLGLNYAYGDRVGVQFSFAANPNRSGFGPQISPAPAPVLVRAEGSAADLGWTGLPGGATQVRARTAEALAEEGLRLEQMALSGTSAEIYFANTRWPVLSQALGRAARVLSRTLPSSVEEISMAAVSEGVAGARMSFARSDLERYEHASADDMLAATTFSDAARPSEGMEVVPDLYPRLSWSISPDVVSSFFDPQQPVRSDLMLRFAGTYRPAPGWVLSGVVDYRLTGTLDEVIRPSDSVLQRVRSDVAQYMAEGGTAITRLQFAHYGRPGRNLYSRITAGILERQYSGLSGELLWKPVDSRLALGLEVTAVRQRAFDGGFGLRDYQTVTGFASAYYEFGDGYVAQIHAGRYLAGDLGATFVLDRTFQNGWSVGAFATLTNVSAEDFGEGSFDKGIFMTIPLTWITGQPTTTVSQTVLRPLTRDGGQRVDVHGRLYGSVAGKHRGAVVDSWGMFWR